ncbi:cyclic nucleotide-binding domain-containing protein [Phytomonospora sp. NPDC050363]|uniref:Crp/Fnr family transcriptional regulator n=1 Tax=Phytomonospora sp. NPDC050363 TaxID=3155642 RepID=UPI00340E27A4
MPSLSELKGFAPFRDFQRSHLAQLAATARDVHYRPGDRLFKEGTPAWGCWLITSGQVILDAEGAVLETLGAGDLVGWSWLVPPHRWHFGATAVTDVSAIVLDTDRLKNFAEGDPGLGYAVTRTLFSVLLQRLQATRFRLLEMRSEKPIQPIRRPTMQDYFPKSDQKGAVR